jgi:hypothetical protein
MGTKGSITKVQSTGEFSNLSYRLDAPPQRATKFPFPGEFGLERCGFYTFLTNLLNIVLIN